MAKGGDKDVKIVFGQSVSTRRRPSKPKSLLDKPLRKLEAFGLEPASRIAAGKRILICFWDFEQRPARRAVRQLAGKAAELRENGVVVLTVHAFAADEKQLRDWAAKYKMNLPIGMVPAGRKKAVRAMLNWGVAGLPWLILTDADHVVRAEGFSPAELDRKLKDIVDK